MTSLNQTLECHAGDVVSSSNFELAELLPVLQGINPVVAELMAFLEDAVQRRLRDARNRHPGDLSLPTACQRTRGSSATSRGDLLYMHQVLIYPTKRYLEEPYQMVIPRVRNGLRQVPPRTRCRHHT